MTLDKAVQAAMAAVPGKAVEAEIDKEAGRVVYEVESVDNNKAQKVYVDAQTLQTRIDREERRAPHRTAFRSACSPGY